MTPRACASLVVASVSAALACAPAAPAPDRGSAQAATASSVHAVTVDAMPRVLVMTAMQSELDPLLQSAEVERSEVVAGRNYYLGRLGGLDVVLLAGGVSMVNGALSAQEALHHFAVTGIVFSGVAGGVSPEYEVGHVTVPARWAQYQEHWFTDDPEEAAERQLGNFGMMYPGPVHVAQEGGLADEPESKLWFSVDPAMLAAAKRATAAGIELERCNRDGHCVERPPGIAIGGDAVSGPTYVNHGAYRRWVWEAFAADVLDMETAAVAHVAYANRVPYIAVRAISDLAGGHDDRNRYRSFTRMASRNAAAVTLALLEELRRR